MIALAILSGFGLGVILFGPVIVVTKLKAARVRQRHLAGYAEPSAALRREREDEQLLLAAHEDDVRRGYAYRQPGAAGETTGRDHR